MEFFSTNNLIVHIPLGSGGYDLSWIEAIGTLAGLLCIWLASREKIINYLFGIINVILFAVIFFQIQLYSSLLLQLFFLVANVYGWYAWSRQTEDNQRVLHIRWMTPAALIRWVLFALVAIALMTCFIDPVFAFLTKISITLINQFGFSLMMPDLQPDAFPFWDACLLVLSVIAMILMTRKYVENWILWVIINVISVMIFTRQGVYAMALEYTLLTLIALNGVRLWIKSAQKDN
ncbi:MAG: Nicotinamide riboside transporter PnuC [Candidatus Erwinia impunctatus]|nr:Nicotinamide riboside transporter PnuC [Culicoides impunctatus]